MDDLKIPGLLTPELIQSLADNADALKTVLNPQNDQTLLSNGDANGANSERVTRIRFVLCNVIIINRND